MFIRRSFLSHAVIGLAVATTGCSRAITPAEIGRHQGGLFGTIEVLNNSQPMTDGCEVVFSDGKGTEQAAVTVDESGWIIAAVNPGQTYLSSVTCKAGTGVKYEAQYKGRDLEIHVPGDGQIAYFGNVQLVLTSDFNEDKAGAALVLGALGGVIPTLIAGGLSADAQGSHRGWHATVENLINTATEQYHSRYPNAPSLEIVTALASTSADRAAAEAGKAKVAPLPEGFGFDFDEGPEDAASSCQEAGYQWSEKDGVFLCSGVPSFDIKGASAEFSFGPGRVLRMRIFVHPQDNSGSWAGAMTTTETTLKRMYGEPKSRNFTFPPECAKQDFMGCATDGRVKGEASWTTQKTMRSVAMAIVNGESPMLVVDLTRVRPAPAPSAP